METIKLKARIDADARFEWLEPLPDLPSGEVEVILRYHHWNKMKLPFQSVHPDEFQEDIEEIQENEFDSIDQDENNDLDSLASDEYNSHVMPKPSPEEIESRLKWLDEHVGCIQLSAKQAMEIAMDDWIGEENLGL